MANLRLFHIRQTEVLYYANNYHLPNYKTNKNGRATDSCFVLIGTHKCGILYAGLKLCKDQVRALHRCFWSHARGLEDCVG